MKKQLPKNIASMVRALASGGKKKKKSLAAVDPSNASKDGKQISDTRRDRHRALTEEEFQDCILCHLGSIHSTCTSNKEVDAKGPTLLQENVPNLVSEGSIGDDDRNDNDLSNQQPQQLPFPTHWLKSNICRCRRKKRVRLTSSTMSPILTSDSNAVLQSTTTTTTTCGCRTPPVMNSPVLLGHKATIPLPPHPSTPSANTTISFEELLHSLQSDRRRSHNLAMSAADFETNILPYLVVPSTFSDELSIPQDSALLEGN